jgi:hypothetical protein
MVKRGGDHVSSKAEAIQIHDAVEKRALSIAFSFKRLQQLFFGSGPEDKERVGKRLAVMREVGRDFFVIVKEALVDSVFLGLAVQGDPASSGKHENLSVPRLFEAFESAALADTALHARLDEVRRERDGF